MNTEADFRDWVRTELSARLEPRRDDQAVSVLGAGNDDLEAGRRYLGALVGSGLAVPSWPREYGGLASSSDDVAFVRRELAAFAVPDLYPYLVAVELVGPTLLAHGTPAQCERWLPPIASGAEIWCQLFSEPGAGSDLAGLSTRARADGETWRVSGQKVWTSRGAYSRYGLLLARSDPAVPKHRGITAFGLDLRTPGVEVRPLRQMNGDAHFTEVFLDDVVIPDSDRIGPAGDGWRVALTCLSFERGAVAAGGSGGLLDVDRLIALARERNLDSDPAVRDALARLVVDTRVMSLTARRARDMAGTGRPGPEGSGMKLRGSRTFRDFTNLALRLLGADALTSDAEPWHTLFLTAPSLSIRGGTDEIQRNIIGERILGLAEEPRLDRTLPFDQLPEVTMAIVIRPADPADIDAVADVFRRSSLSNDGDRANILANPEVLEFDDACVREGRTWVAVDNDRVVGFVSTTPNGDFDELDDLFVDPDHMRRGIARALMRDLAEVRAARGVRRIEVTANNHALAFYLAAGFALDGVTQTRFGPASRMHLSL